MQPPNRHFLLSATMNGTHTPGHWLVHEDGNVCTAVCQKHILAEVTLKSEKFKLIALAIIKLHLSEGIS